MNDDQMTIFRCSNVQLETHAKFETHRKRGQGIFRGVSQQAAMRDRDRRFCPNGISVRKADYQLDD